jgi:ATP adenylyltransferase/5',5'''-P-1,P-4-tetraphosphate phosphorylase II
MAEPHQLPLPYRHTYTPLPYPAPTAHILHALYTAHLALLPEGVTSYNILLTQHGLHVIPRAERDTVIPLPRSAKGEGEDEEESWTLSTNALGFAGWFFVDPSKEDVLRDFTPSAVLRNAGVAID